MKTFMYRPVLLALLVALILGACGSDKDQKDSGPTDEPKPVIRLAANFWVSSELNAAVARIILEEEMGYPVEIVQLDENDQWARLAAGELHANLEVWTSGHTANIQKYIIEEKTVENGGPLGVEGRIGWFVPSYMIRRHPDLRTWEGFQQPELATLFDTEATTGTKGQFLAGAPDWIQYDADIIRNLGLDLEVVTLGSEEKLLEALETAYANEEPILMYFWTPHWFLAAYDMTIVQLPPYSDECYARRDAGGVDCGYPPDPLFKVFWAGLKDYAPDAYLFLQNFYYSNLDQINMLVGVQMSGQSVEEAAQTWVNTHQAVWSQWVPQP
jgi:glycine betaine/proline transport system substrate-binding protein